MTSARQLNDRVKGTTGWLVLLVVVVVVFVVGATRSAGPQTQGDRIDGLAKRVACPVCNGESVFESRDNSSVQIRVELTSLVRDARLSDDEIIGQLETTYGADVLLVPRASGFDALIWVLPAMAFVAGVAGLAIAFRRWSREAAEIGPVSDADRALVEAAQARADEST